MTAIALFIALVIALIAVECFARYAIKFGPYRVWPPGRKESMTLDLEANPTLPREIKFTINELGERSLSLPTKGTYNVLAAGGSAVECYMLDDTTSWPHLLAERLHEDKYQEVANTKPVHVGNVGRAGVDSTTLDQIFTRLLPQYKHLDLIIIMVGASDVLRWLESGADPQSPARPLAVRESFAWHPEVSLGWHPKRWGLAEVYRRARSKHPLHKQDALKWYTRARQMRRDAPTTHSAAPAHAAVLSEFESSMRSLLRCAQRHADDVLVVLQPWYRKDSYAKEDEVLFWNGGVGKAHRDDIKEYYSSAVISKMMDEISNSATALCEELKLPVLDLLLYLEPSQKHFVDQFHFTPEASAKVADAVANKLRSYRMSKGER